MIDASNNMIFLCINRAFDTLAKVLHPSEGSAGESLEATMQLMSGDQSGPVVELEGSLLSESHFPFKVNNSPWSSGVNLRSELLVLCVSGCVHIHFQSDPLWFRQASHERSQWQLLLQTCPAPDFWLPVTCSSNLTPTWTQQTTRLTVTQ